MKRAAGLLALSVVMAVLHTWPLAANLTGLSRLDNADTALNMWIVSWVSHAVFTNPAGLFDAPIFHPEAHTLAYSEYMLVQSVMGAPLLRAGLSPVTVYNLLAIAGLALSAWAMTLLVTAWTGRLAAGIVAGLLFAFNAHLLTRFVHLQALHIEFLPATLYFFDRVLRGGGVRDAMLLAVSFILQALCSNYLMVFVAATLVAAALVRAREWTAGPARRRSLHLALAGAISAALLAPLLWPYYVVARDQGLARSIEEVALYSAGGLDYLTTGGRLHYAWWSHRVFEGRTALFPGVTAVALAGVALSRRGLRGDPRVRMTIAFGVLGFLLSFGPGLPGYAWLHAHVPLLQGLRAAARWGLLPLVAVALLAGYGTAVIDKRLERSQWRLAILIGIAGLVTIEALRAPMGFVSYAGIPAIYQRLAGDRDAVVAEFPIYFGERIARNAPAMVGNTQYLGPLVNGYSGFQPASFVERATRLRPFPAPEAVAELRRLGVNRVIVRRQEYAELEGAARLRAVEASPDLTRLASGDGIDLYALKP